jgi:aspartate racemase
VGVDSSTQSCKVVIRDAASGEVVRSGRAAHPEGTEVAPDAWWAALLAAVSDAGVHIVGLLGTAFTMEQDFYVDRLAASGLDVLVPPPADRAEVHRIIYDELCLGIVLDESRQVYREVIDHLVAAGAEGIILGCTEIELLITAGDSPVPVFPTTRLHVEAAVDLALARH